jgi:hypothetical protein
MSLDEKSLSKLVKRLPPAFGYSIQDNLEPTLAWLQERLDRMAGNSLSKLVQRLRAVVGYSIEDNHEPKLELCPEVVFDAISKCRTAWSGLVG